MIRILIVDNDASALASLEARLRPLRDRWNMRFIVGTKEASRELTLEPADVVITEMCDPMQDGISLLHRVRSTWPSTVRLMLSKETARDVVMRALPVAHQFLAKPCDVGHLEQVVARSCALQARVHGDGVMAALGTLWSLPSVPKLYQQLSAELDGGRASPKSVAEIIECDVAMTARVLQLVNSAYFGLSRRIASIREAVTLLGFEPIRILVASSELFRGMSKMCSPTGFSLEAVQQHSQRVGTIAASLLTDRELSRSVLSAAMLHDIGEIVLAVSMPEGYARSRAIAATQQISLIDAEQQVFDCTHADIGAHVLSLWGLPTALIEAVAFHHEPALAGESQFGITGAIHVADALHYLQREGRGTVPDTSHIPVDRAYLESAGKLDALPRWLSVLGVAIAA